MTSPGPKKFWMKFGIKSLLVVILIIAAEMLIASRYHIALVANIPCLPARMYLYRFTSSENFHRGDQLVFKTDERHYPRFPVGRDGKFPFPGHRTAPRTVR